MNPGSLGRLLLPILLLGLSACGPGAPGPAAEPATQTPEAQAPTAPAPLPTNTPEPTAAPGLSFTAAPYRDEAAGFELDRPADWSLQPPASVGSRGTQALLLSPGSTLETLAAEGSRVAITVYAWEPRNDLAAYAAHRRTAWEASGFTFLSEASGRLADGRPAMTYVVQTSDGLRVFFQFTTVGEHYLEISGEGDLTLIEEVARTVRPLPAQP